MPKEKRRNIINRGLNVQRIPLGTQQFQNDAVPYLSTSSFGHLPQQHRKTKLGCRERSINSGQRCAMCAPMHAQRNLSCHQQLRWTCLLVRQPISNSESTNVSNPRTTSSSPLARARLPPSSSKSITQPAKPHTSDTILLTKGRY